MAGASIGAVDEHVGRRVKAAREAMGMTQEKLGNAIGVTFQQVQKYEKGKNRIGTGRLHAIAQFLDTPLSFFFQGIGLGFNGADDDALRAASDALSTKDGVRIALALSRIKNARVRRRIVDLLEAIIENETKEIRVANPPR